MTEIRALTHRVKRELGPNQQFVLFLLDEDPQGTVSSYASSLERSEAMRFLMDASVGIREGLEPRVMGNEMNALSEPHVVALFELLEHLFTASKDRVSRVVWRDVLLVFCTGMAHDQGITRGDFERCALECAQEEWSTPSTEGRNALGALLEKTKPAG